MAANDPRFSAMHNAPIFGKQKKDSFKTKVDSRFSGLLNDDRFVGEGKTDVYGRKKGKGKAGDSKEKKALQSLYAVDGDKEKKTDERKKNATPGGKGERQNKGGEETAEAAPKANAPKASKETRLEYLNRLVRGEVDVSSSSEDEDSDSNSDGSSSSDDESSGSSEENDDENSSDDESDGGQRRRKKSSKSSASALAIPVVTSDGRIVQPKKGKRSKTAAEEEAAADAEDEQYDRSSDIVSDTLAIQNCGWDNISAKDIMAILQSFCPAGRKVVSVSIYLSDFGSARLREEEEHGPRDIWTKNKDDDEEDDEDEEDEESEEGSSDESEEEGGVAGGDFKRKKGQVGLVWADENEEEGARGKSAKLNKKKSAAASVKAALGDSDSDSDSDDAGSDGDDSGSEDDCGDEDEESDDGHFHKQERIHPQQKGNGKNAAKKLKKQTQEASDYDEVAVRRYELSRLKYYFAIAVCDSTSTAALLYEQLDGIEFQHSSMSFDLSLVPPEVTPTFADRVVKDRCSELSVNKYQPPQQFVVNALQHTNVECSWDKGESVREKKLTQISQWRKLQDSDFAQYIASESEAESDGGEGSDGDGGKGSRDQKAKMFRKMLLGEDSGDEGEGEGAKDSFFMPADGDNDDDEQVHKTFSFTPKGDADDSDDSDEEDKGKKKGKATKGKKGKGKAAAKFSADSDGDSDSDAQDSDDESAVNGKGKGGKKSKQMLSMVLSDKAKGKGKHGDSDDDDDDDLPESRHEYDMHAIRKAEKKRLRKEEKRNKLLGNKRAHDEKKSAAAGGEAGSQFNVNTGDSRFKSLLDSSVFAIDPTAAEYKATPAMQKLLADQQTVLLKKQQEEDRRFSAGEPMEDAEEDEDDSAEPASTKKKRRSSSNDGTSGAADSGVKKAKVVESLADKVKQKFAKHSASTPGSSTKAKKA